MAAMVVLATASLAAEGASGASTSRPPRITIAILPHGTTPAQLAEVDGMAVGLLSAGIGSVPAAQTWIDIGQGARINESLYDEGLPRLYVDPGLGGAPPHVPPTLWQRVRDRAQAAPADLVPGLLGATLKRGRAAPAAARPVDPSAAILVGTKGAILEGRQCRQRPCARVTIVTADLDRVHALAGRLGGDDLVIAIERPPPGRDRQLAAGVAGEGFQGTLSSDSTRTRGYALATDIAPTILERLGLSVPDEVSGEPIEATGELDPGFVERLEDRLAAVGPRRGPVIGANLLIWVGLALLAAVAWRPRGLRAALPLLAVTVAYLPAVLLLTAALQPSELAERLIAGVGSPALALVTLRLASPYGALALAGAASVLGYAIDVIAGSPLTALSLVGPNPAAGVRFFGIGNELEAIVAALVPIATGAGLAAWAPRISPRGAAFAFAATGLVAVAAFAPGRFGADVGAAIGIPVGAAVAATACLSGSRRRLLWALAVPVVALAVLGAADLLLGGNAHLTGSVLEAGGLDQLADVAERRLRLSAGNFSRYAATPLLWICALVIVAGIAERRRIEAWFEDRRTAWAGLGGAAAATVAGTLANDSGALVLMVGTALCALTAGLAWATHRPGTPSHARERVL
ncbi:MAG: hypothetical protein AABM66_09720 [Actinomycetota bacterium]